ncbi:MAG: DUF3772 domain-containing protein [Polyangiales bacterium]
MPTKSLKAIAAFQSRSTPRLVYAISVLLVWVVNAVAGAQAPDLDQIRADLKSRADQLDELAHQLDSADISDERLDRYSQELVEYDDQTESEIKAIDGAIREPQARLLTLGPPPAPNEQPESADLTKLRSQLTDEVAQLTGLSKEAQLTQAIIGELVDRIERRRRERLLSSLRARGPSALSPALWTQAAAEIPPAWDALASYYTTGREARTATQSWTADLALLLVALALAIGALFVPRLRGWRQFETKLAGDPKPSALSKRRLVALRSLSRALLVLAAGALLYLAGLETQVIAPTDEGLALRLCLGAAAWTLVFRYAQDFFSPSEPAWRIPRCDTRAARRLRSFLVGAFTAFVADRLLHVALAQIDVGAELPKALRVLTTAVFATLVWFLLSPRLWREGAHTNERRPWPREAMRRVGRLFTIALMGFLALGYVRLASFLFLRFSLLCLFILLFWCVHTLAVWGLSKLPTTSSTTEDKESEDDQPEDEEEPKATLGFWLRLGLELNLLLVAVPAFLLVFGFDWLEVRRVFDWLGSDVHLGKLSLSFPDVLVAVIVFFVISAGTRWVTGMVERRLLKSHASVEAEAQSSVATLVNYAGLLIALLISLPIAGIGFSKLALIAGALSVGIGFGLQTIVNNFVSGLILLFERPIRAGDWVVVDSGEGYVKSIGARATEIRTFDGASIIIPNSELVSSAVQNWFHGTRIGRIRVMVGVAYASDPARVREILVQCANEHDSIMPYPAPEVIFHEFGDSSLAFELRAYLRNYNNAYRVRSDLHFAIFAAFDKAGIVIPFPQRDVHMYTEPAKEPSA